MKEFRRTMAVATAGVLALTAAGCGGVVGGGDDGGGGGGDDGPIKIGILADLTGATGDVGTPYNEGMLAYVDHLNAEGGIDGREIEALSNDYAYEVPEAERLYKQYVSEGVVAIQGWGTGDTEALVQDVARDELPFISASYAEPLTNPEEAPYNFIVAATYSDQMRIALDWIASENEGEHSEVAVFHHDSPFGTAPVADGEEWIGEQGYDMGYQPYAMTATANYVGLLSQAKRQGAKYIVIQNVSSPAAQVAKDIAAQNLDMQIVCLNWCADNLFIRTAGDQAADGHTMVQPFAPPVAEAEGLTVVNDYLAEQGSSLEEVLGIHFAQGWYAMHVMTEAIRHVIEEGDEVTGPAIKEALETMGPIDTGGVIGGGDVEFSTDSHRGSTSAGIYQVQDGELSVVTDQASPGE
jgi:branched-chain amino acid transport system substrate-binding protein